MKFKLLAIMIVGSNLFPAAAFAAYNDVTLTTSAVIQVGGTTLNVYGSSAAVQSITVNPTNFIITLGTGSSITISSPSLNQLSSDIQSDVVSNVCSGSLSSISLSYAGAGTVTNTITPSPTICSGSGSSPVTPPTVIYSSGGGGSVSAAMLSALLAPSASTTAYLNSLATSTLPGCPMGFVCTRQAATVTASSFNRNLAMGFSGSDVKSLQQYLNGHGFLIASGGAGSIGHETTMFGVLTKAALVRFQKAHGIPSTGFFGPITREYIFNH